MFAIHFQSRRRCSCPELLLFTLQHALTSAQALSCWKPEFLNIFHRRPLKRNVDEIFSIFPFVWKRPKPNQKRLCASCPACFLFRSELRRRPAKLFITQMSHTVSRGNMFPLVPRSHTGLFLLNQTHTTRPLPSIQSQMFIHGGTKAPHNCVLIKLIFGSNQTCTVPSCFYL